FAGRSIRSAAVRPVVAVARPVVVRAVVAVVAVPAGRWRGVVAGLLAGLATAELVHELVEHVSHGVGSIAYERPEAGIRLPLGPAEALDRPAEPGEDHVRELV